MCLDTSKGRNVPRTSSKSFDFCSLLGIGISYTTNMEMDAVWTFQSCWTLNLDMDQDIMYDGSVKLYVLICARNVVECW